MLRAKLFGGVVGFIIAALVFGGAAFSFERSHGGWWKGGARLQRLAAYLGVTDQQRSEIRSIVVGACKKAKAVKADSGLTDSQKLERAQAIRAGARNEIRSVLTPVQRERLETLKRKMEKTWIDSTPPATSNP